MLIPANSGTLLQNGQRDKLFPLLLACGSRFGVNRNRRRRPGRWPCRRRRPRRGRGCAPHCVDALGRHCRPLLCRVWTSRQPPLPSAVVPREAAREDAASPSAAAVALGMDERLGPRRSLWPRWALPGREPALGHCRHRRGAWPRALLGHACAGRCGTPPSPAVGGHRCR